MTTKSYFLLLSALLCSSSTLVSGATTMSPDLFAYWDFATEIKQNVATNPIKVNPTYSKTELYTNIYNTISGGASSTHHSTGGAFNGGYIAANSQNATLGKNFHIYAGLADMSTEADRGFAISMQTKADSAGAVSFSFNFLGNSVDSTFKITNNTLELGGFMENGWTITTCTSLSADNWSSLVLSVGNNGIANIYLGGALFAKSNASMFADASWNNNNRWKGQMEKFGLGGKIEGNYQPTQSSFSDLALWDKSLSAEDAAFLATNSGRLLGSVPEPGTAVLTLLGASMFLLRRKIRA